MITKQTYLLRASFAFLAFVMLGYVVKFYPEGLTEFDASIQKVIRGDLPQTLTTLFKKITFIGNTGTQIVIAVLSVLILLMKKWYLEAAYVGGNAVLAGIFITVLKNLYQRPRPSLSHLVHATSFSFPSGHALGTFMIIGSILVICYQRMTVGKLKTLVATILGLLIFMVGLSRIYLGVHYPSDVLAGFIVAYGLHNLVFPFYNQKRFEWRFQSKQN